MKSIKFIGAVGAGAALLAGVAGVQMASAAATGCAALDDRIYQVVNPSVGSSRLTSSASEANQLAASGFTENRGPVFLGSTTAASGLTGVHRLYKPATKDYLYATSASEVTSATKIGYTDQGIDFYASPVAGSACDQVVPRLVKGTQHRLAGAPGDQAALTAAGWKLEGLRLFVRTTPTVSDPATPPAGGTTTPATSTKGPFKFAVIPDTQNEVLKAEDQRIRHRNQWLVSQKTAFVAQTGDLVNWDTEGHEQYSRAKAGMNVLTHNHTPYTVAVGNHDTMATGVGGSARPGKTWELVRDTRTLNSYFDAQDFGNIGGAFEPGKIDNVYATYSAGGKKFMVITLEFCARAAVIEWARSVVASHPDYNVIISTHSYLTSNNAISKSNGGYGSTTPQYVFDRLIKQYPNIKMVFSGHVGYAAKARVDTGVKGNKIYSFLTTFHEGTTNPVRILTVDPQRGKVSSTIYAPFTGTYWHTYDQTITGIDFV